MKTSHTPGPWTATDTPPFRIRAEGEGMSVAVAFQFRDGAPDRDIAQVNANARLIAAAPDLLAACQLALNTLAPPRGSATAWVCATLRAAIAKAQSEKPKP